MYLVVFIIKLHENNYPAELWTIWDLGRASGTLPGTIIIDLGKRECEKENFPTTPFSFFSPFLPTPLQLHIEKKQGSLQQNIEF